MAGTEFQTAAGADDGAGEFNGPFQNLLRDGRQRLRQVTAALDEIELHYRGRSEDRSYRQFIAALRLANQAAAEALTDAANQFEHHPEAAYDKARTLMQGFSPKHEMLVDYLRSGRQEPLEVFSQPFTRLVKRLLPNTEALFLGWKLESYELRVYDADQASRFTSGAAVSSRREFGKNFQFLQFMHPVLRQADVFQQAAFGHELGHPLIRQPPPPAVVESLQASGQAPDYANVAVQFADREFGNKGLGRGDKQRSRLHQWFDEIACDIIGMRLLGPAFALAFIEVTAANWDFERDAQTDSRRYPPQSMRLSYLSQEMERFKLPAPFDEKLRAAIDHSKPLSRGTDPDSEIDQASAWMTSAVDVFREHCLAPLLKGEELQPDDLSRDFGGIASLIRAGVPPAEKLLVAEGPVPSDPDRLWDWSQEYDWRLILNGTRMALIDSLGGESSADNRAKACELATGAIEMAEFQRRARKLRQQYELIGGLEVG